MPDKRNIGAIVLAAGASRRMGRNKALLPIDGKPMLARVVEALATARVAPIILVTGHDPDAIKSLVTNIKLVHNPHYATRGMLSSIKTGVRSIIGDPSISCDGLFLALVDQPFIKCSTLQQLIETFHDTRADVLRPTYRGKHGHPILIASRCLASILALADDQNLNDFVRAKSTRAVDVPVEDSATIQDIDTPADYDAATRRPASDSSAD